MTPTRSDLLHSFFCSLLATAALLLTWPFANLAFNDDWTWAFTVLQLSKTGHLIYNGWSSPPVIAQAYWGWLWVKLFGFSFKVLRVSTMPMAAGAVSVCFLLGRRAGLSSRSSVFIALMLGFSPLFMPLASSFMTDVPGLFFMLLSLYALVIGLEKQSTGASAAWLAVGVIAALLGGSSRQVVWIVPLVVLPYFAFVRRSELIFVVVSLAGWMVVFTGAIAMQHWFAKQPYALPDPPALSYLHFLLKQPKKVGLGIINIILTSVMMMLPAVLVTTHRWRRPRTIAAMLLTVLFWVVLRHIGRNTEPWMGNIFSSTGVLSSIEVGGDRPVVFGHRGRLILSLATIGGLSLLLTSAAIWLWQCRSEAVQRIIGFFIQPRIDQSAVPAMVLLGMAIFSLEITRAISGVAYDRHLLPFIPFLGIPLVCFYQRESLPGLRIAGWAALSVYGIYAVASTQEVNALARARVTAIQRLEAGGLSATQIDAGFEHSYWTQVNIEGHVNDARLKNPPGAYHSTQGPTPAMHVLYRLESRPTAVTAITSFGSVKYFSLLPPFHRTVLIDRFIDPWWLDPAKTSTRPTYSRQQLPQILLDQYK